MDHLFLDQDSIPTLVTVKRSRNVETRQKMIGQMLDNAANLGLYRPIESLILKLTVEIKVEILNKCLKISRFASK